jgi:hypothetical protein
MYQILIFFHSFTRWLVLGCMIFAIWRASRGYFSRAVFTKTDNAARHWTATVAHIQLVIGMVLYFQSPITYYFRSHYQEAIKSLDTTFFGMIHPLLMICAIVVVTIGSALAKRRGTDHSKFKTMLFWFSAALIIIIISIPWPFSPLASRPFFR